MKNRIKKLLRYLIVKLVVLTAAMQCSILPLRWLGRFASFPLYYVLRDKYYRMLIEAQKGTVKNKAKRPAFFARNLPQPFFIRAIRGEVTASADEYLNLLNKVPLSAEMKFQWAQRYMSLGRLDLALAGFVELTQDTLNPVPAEIKLDALRYAGICNFLLGKSSEANHYWQLTGQLRKNLSVTMPAKKYRILGVGWCAAIGHVAMLDYYLKYLHLYAEKEVRIVAPWRASQMPWQELMNKFAPLGITMIDPDDLEQDYNRWAEKEGALKWNLLSPGEKATLVDDFWDYDFPGAETLGFAPAIARIQQKWEETGQPPLFSLTEQEKECVSSYLSILGVPKNAWYVCLHVREAGFHKAWNSLYPSMRDAEIADYTLAIEKIVEAGGWVLRMGDASMKPLAPRSQVIDYAHSIHKTPMADLLLAASCRFILGTNSGFVNLSTIYNVPCLLTNWVPIGWPLWPSQDLMIPKLFRDKKSGRYLNLEQIFEQGLAFLQNQSDVASTIELVANTPEEIATLTSEMLAYFNLNTSQSPSSVLGASSSVQDYYRKIAKRYGGFTGSYLARAFVERHADIFKVPEMEAQVLEQTG